MPITTNRRKPSGFPWLWASLALGFLSCAGTKPEQPQATWVAVMQVVGDGRLGEEYYRNDTRYLTDQLRASADFVLPASHHFNILTADAIVSLLPPNEVQECLEAQCAVEIGRRINADYITDATVSFMKSGYAFTAYLYDTRSGRLVGTYSKRTNSFNFDELFQIVEQSSYQLFVKVPNADTVAVQKKEALEAMRVEAIRRQQQQQRQQEAVAARAAAKTAPSYDDSDEQEATESARLEAIRRQQEIEMRRLEAIQAQQDREEREARQRQAEINKQKRIQAQRQAEERRRAQAQQERSRPPPPKRAPPPVRSKVGSKRK
jgi:hypothetical protein